MTAAAGSITSGGIGALAVWIRNWDDSISGFSGQLSVSGYSGGELIPIRS